MITLLLLTVAGLASQQSGSPWPQAEAPIVAKGASAPQPIGLEVKDNVKVVYHIKVKDVRPDGVAQGVAELRHLIRIYNQQGVTRDKRDIHAVFDADGVPFVLKDEAYARIGAGDRNATAPLIAELIEEGVAVEVCGQRMARDKLTRDVRCRVN